MIGRSKGGCALEAIKLASTAARASRNRAWQPHIEPDLVETAADPTQSHRQYMYPAAPL
jgi:hypothetical protein